MTGVQTAPRPLDDTDALPRMRATLAGGLVSVSDRTGGGSRSGLRADAATLGGPVILPLRKVR